MTREEIEATIRDEMTTASGKYGPFASAHEGLGVLTEEVKELTEAIHENAGGAIRHEAMQCAAVAWRLALSLNHLETRKRSGLE